MEQRVYRGDIDPQELADFLVSHFDPQEDLQAQQIGQQGAHLVQIGRGDVHAVTVAIARDEDTFGLRVSMGQQQWLNPQTATHAAAIGLISLLITPWALFALLWPLSDVVGKATLPDDIWNAIDTYVAGKGGSLDITQQIQHPHASSF
jgi:hypothetical protein